MFTRRERERGEYSPAHARLCVLICLPTPASQIQKRKFEPSRTWTRLQMIVIIIYYY